MINLLLPVVVLLSSYYCIVANLLVIVKSDFS